MSTPIETPNVLRQQMTLLVLNMARTLVDEIDQVHVEALEEATGTVLRLQVAPGDLGKVIGKQGRTARSIRTILAAASMKAHYRFSLDIQQTGQANGTTAQGPAISADEEA